uniref:Macaca fascicularis brain cDNA clone: QmoA-10496, similar to human metastasis associated in lung adenocarcinoma transcript1 (MALAT-1), misc RNA, RefSeq: XR_000218.1 n=1 Tax=Macaca fascicularis TaxID=9541 RepID=I7G808_MACFA|nr:unnamed protein product [Macaca fascicularis]
MRDELGSSGLRRLCCVPIFRLPQTGISSLSEELLHFIWEQKTAGSC